MFSGTCFKKHFSQTTGETRSIHPFFYLLSTTDCSHNINQFREKVSLHPIDCIYEDFRQYSKTGEDFMPIDLESRDIEKRTKAAEIVRKFLRMR